MSDSNRSGMHIQAYCLYKQNTSPVFYKVIESRIPGRLGTFKPLVDPGLAAIRQLDAHPFIANSQALITVQAQ